MKVSREIAGIKLLDCFSAEDNRGRFTKIYYLQEYMAHEVKMNVQEIYYSVSHRDVIRGMHFQIPPADHEKLVHVIHGKVLDVVVDIRKESDTYGSTFAFELSGDKPQALFLPKGFAHGFKSLADNTVMLYMVSTGYSKEHDMGIAYDSVGFDWKTESPIVSGRDLTFPRLEDFDSPF